MKIIPSINYLCQKINFPSSIFHTIFYKIVYFPDNNNNNDDAKYYL